MIWDIPPEDLCTIHLVSQHVEIHQMALEPDERWQGHLQGLRELHEWTSREMAIRGIKHHSEIGIEKHGEVSFPPFRVELKEQSDELRRKHQWWSERGGIKDRRCG